MSVLSSSRFRRFGLLTITWTAAWCGDVWEAWQHAPYDRAGLVGATLWIAAAAFAPRQATPARLLLAAAWLGSMLGVMGELHVARHAALVCAVGAWLPGWRLQMAVAVAALSWMPAFGWLLAAWSPAIVNALRVALAAGALGAALLPRFRRERFVA